LEIIRPKMMIVENLGSHMTQKRLETIENLIL
jgi:hypothetical protein